MDSDETVEQHKEWISRIFHLYAKRNINLSEQKMHFIQSKLESSWKINRPRYPHFE
jgi:hypothetical protein